MEKKHKQKNSENESNYMYSATPSSCFYKYWTHASNQKEIQYTLTANLNYWKKY